MGHSRNRLPTSFTLSDEAKEMLEKIATTIGAPKSTTVEILIREKYADLRKEGRLRLL